MCQRAGCSVGDADSALPQSPCSVGGRRQGDRLPECLRLISLRPQNGRYRCAVAKGAGRGGDGHGVMVLVGDGREGEIVVERERAGVDS